jgi:hypothetical protein
VQSGQLQLFMSFFFDELCVDYKNECSHLISNELGALRISPLANLKVQGAVFEVKEAVV